MTPETLFATHFLPLYPEDARTGLALAAARSVDRNPGRNPSIYGHLRDAARIFAARNPEPELDFSDASVHRLSAWLTAERRDAWAQQGEGPQNELFNAVVHGAAYVGECVVRNHGGEWGVRRPLWESVVRLRSRAGEADLAIFHWWLKALAGHGTLADRYRAHVEVPRARPEELEPITPSPRALPRITKTRYDVLHKYLKAHLPELRDLGADFPSPERFDAYRFEWLQPLLLGEGRMLLLWGPGEGGVHLFWLTRAGFDKAAHFPGDRAPSPEVTASGEKLVIATSHEGRRVVHETMWWGP